MLHAGLLAAIAGYADTVGFIRFDSFAGLMTGNTILLGSEIWRLETAEALFHLAVIAMFLAGVVLSRAMLRYGAAPWTPLTFTALGMVCCSFMPRVPAALLLALSMGVQNAAVTRFGDFSLNTVFITGNLQKLGEALIDWLLPHKGHVGGLDGVTIFALVWASYLIGAVLGAGANSLTPYPLIIPALLLPLVTLRRPS